LRPPANDSQIIFYFTNLIIYCFVTVVILNNIPILLFVLYYENVRIKLTGADLRCSTQNNFILSFSAEGSVSEAGPVFTSGVCILISP